MDSSEVTSKRLLSISMEKIMENFGPENRSGHFHRSFVHYCPHEKKKWKASYYHVIPSINTIPCPSKSWNQRIGQRVVFREDRVGSLRSRIYSEIFFYPEAKGTVCLDPIMAHTEKMRNIFLVGGDKVVNNKLEKKLSQTTYLLLQRQGGCSIIELKFTKTERLSSMKWLIISRKYLTKIMDEKMLLKVIIRTIFALVKKKQAENSGTVSDLPAFPGLYKP